MDCLTPRSLAPCMLAWALLVCTSPVAHAAGKWTPSNPPWDWGDGDPLAPRHAVHMVLLPGDGAPYHSRILWWHEENRANVFKGGQWGWNPSSDDGCATVPSNWDALSAPSAMMDVFCAGHTQLADGTLFLAGGTDRVIGFYGENDSRIFQAGTGTSGGAWSAIDSMAEFRWYPTVTTLRDGRVIALSGSKYRHHRVFGGKRDGSLPPDQSGVGVGDSLYRFAPVPGGAMDITMIPDATPQGERPPVREGPVFVEAEGVLGGEVLFGGLGTSGQALNDVWLLTREPNYTGADYTYKWQRPGVPPFFGPAIMTGSRS